MAQKVRGAAAPGEDAALRNSFGQQPAIELSTSARTGRSYSNRFAFGSLLDKNQTADFEIMGAGGIALSPACLAYMDYGFPVQEGAWNYIALFLARKRPGDAAGI